MVETSLEVPFSRLDDARAITRMALTLERSLISSSVKPSPKNSLAGSGLRLTKGSTAIDASPSGGRTRLGVVGVARIGSGSPATPSLDSAPDPPPVAGRFVGPPPILRLSNASGHAG